MCSNAAGMRRHRDVIHSKDRKTRKTAQGRMPGQGLPRGENVCKACSRNKPRAIPDVSQENKKEGYLRSLECLNLKTLDFGLWALGSPWRCWGDIRRMWPKEYINKVSVKQIWHMDSSCLPGPRSLCELRATIHTQNGCYQISDIPSLWQIWWKPQAGGQLEGHVGVHRGKRSSRDAFGLQETSEVQAAAREDCLTCARWSRPPADTEWQLSFTSEKTTHGISSITLGFCFIFVLFFRGVGDTAVNKNKKTIRLILQTWGSRHLMSKWINKKNKSCQWSKTWRWYNRIIQ